MRLLRFFMRDERGATAVEYGLLVALIAVAMIAGFGAFTDGLTNTFGVIEDRVENPTP